ETPVAPTPSHKPSVIVLPFQSLMPEGPEQILSEAVPHELIQALSRLRWLRVIARGTAFRFREANPELESIGRQLSVRYALSGTIDLCCGLLMFTIELSDCETGDVVWAERFEAKPEGLHDVRHEIVAQVIASLEIYIPLNEATRAEARGSQSLDAWSNYHLGLRHMFRFTADDNARATELFKTAIMQDPIFARAHAGLSFTRFQDAFLNYTADVPDAILDARRFAERSVELDPLDPFSNFTKGRAFWLEGDLAGGLSWLERSVSLSPNFAQGYYSRAFAQVIQGQADEALENAEKALDLSPLDPFLYGVHGVRAMAWLQAGDGERAKAEVEKAARAPGAHFLILMIAAMVHAIAGDDQRAAHWAGLARTRRPDANRQQFFAAFPFGEPGFHKQASDSLARIGF
ncbi:MAG: transcriptional regulator, partial [Pseudomonadota bacterium]